MINDHKLTLVVSHYPKSQPPVYVCWPDAVKDQMLARGCISDNWHLPDGEFQQIIAGMRRLKPGCDELVTALAANNLSKRIIWHLISSRIPFAPDIPGTYPVNSSFGCVPRGLFNPEVKGPPAMRLDATGRAWMNWAWLICVMTPYPPPLPQTPSLHHGNDPTNR